MSVRVALPEPGAAMEVGLKMAVEPVGTPLAVSASAELKPPLTVVLMVLEPEPPRTAVTADDVEIVKSGMDGVPCF